MLFRSVFKSFCFFVTLSLFFFQVNGTLYALPSEYEVVSGDVTVTQVGNDTVHITASDNAVINFTSFNIGAGETVQFFQPGIDASVLNRVTGGSQSQILGNLFANGRVFLVNQSGIYFGANANVNVGSLIASTLDITNEDFLSGNYRFTQGNGIGMIINDGQLSASEGGLVALMSPAEIGRAHV